MVQERPGVIKANLKGQKKNPYYCDSENRRSKNASLTMAFLEIATSKQSPLLTPRPRPAARRLPIWQPCHSGREGGPGLISRNREGNPGQSPLDCGECPGLTAQGLVCLER